MEWQAAPLFATPVFKLSIPDAEKARAFFDDRLRDKTEAEYKDVQGALSHYYSRRNVFEAFPELSWLRERLEQAGALVYNELLNYRKSGRPKITDAWFNLCDIGGTQPMHAHVNCLLSGTLYLVTDENTKIFFDHPLNISSHHAELYDAPSPEPNPHGLRYHQREARIGVSNGDCLFWPSYLKHGYKSNQTPGRLTLSFNLMPDALNVDYQPDNSIFFHGAKSDD